MQLAFHNPTYPTWYEKAIRFKTGGPLVHVEFVFNEISPHPGDFQTSFSSLIGVGTRFQNKINFQTKEWVIVNLPNITTLDWNRAYAYCAGMTHRRYDIWGILGFVTPWGQHDDSDVFCSEVCVDIIQFFYGLGVIFPEQKAWEISPWALYNLVSKKVIA